MLMLLSHYKQERRGSALARTVAGLSSQRANTYQRFPLSGQVAWEEVGELLKLD